MKNSTTIPPVLGLLSFLFMMFVAHKDMHDHQIANAITQQKINSVDSLQNLLDDCQQGSSIRFTDASGTIPYEIEN